MPSLQIALHVCPWITSFEESQVVPFTREPPVGGIENVLSFTLATLQLTLFTHVGIGSGRRSPDTQVTILPLDGIFPESQVSVHEDLPVDANLPLAVVGGVQIFRLNVVPLTSLKTLVLGISMVVEVVLVTVVL